MPKGNGVATAGEMHELAKTNLKAAEDVLWDDNTQQHIDLVRFWAGQVEEYAAMNADTLIPVF